MAKGFADMQGLRRKLVSRLALRTDPYYSFEACIPLTGHFRLTLGHSERKGSDQDTPDPTADNHKAEPSGKQG